MTQEKLPHRKELCLQSESAVFAALFLFRVASTKLSISGIISKEIYKGVIDKL